MPTGVNILCVKSIFHFMVTEQPYCLINNVDKKELKWKKQIFIPLQPTKDYQITVIVPYFGKSCGVIKIILNLNANEVQNYRYNPPMVLTSNGILKRTQ